MTTRVLTSSTRAVLAHRAVPAPSGLGDAVADALTAAGEPAEPVALGDAPSGDVRTQVGGLAAALDAALADGTGHQVDHLHALDLPSALAALTARRRAGARVVVRVQADRTGTGGSRPLGAGDGSPAPRLWPVVVRAADGVVVPSAEDGRVALALGADRRRVVVCPDAALVAARSAAVVPTPAGALPQGDDGPWPYVLGLSGVPESPVVRDQLVRLLVRQPALRLVVTSPSDDDLPVRTALLAEARQAGVLERVVLPGRVGHDVVASLVDGARLVLGTRAEPTSSLAALVAMHRGRAVVSVRSRSSEDVVVDGVTGWLTDDASGRGLADAVGDLVGDDFRCLAWGVAGQDRATHRFAADQIARTLMAVHHLAA